MTTESNSLLKSAWLPVVGLLAAPLYVHATTLWYNGDFDGNDAARNDYNVPINIGGSYFLQSSLVYTDFIVSVGQTWTVTSVFSNNQEAYAVQPSTATWQIRTGVTVGQGGAVVAQGDTAATVTAKSPEDGTTYADQEYQIAAAVPNVTLTAGLYYLAVAPDSTGYYGDQSYIETTSGANAQGLPPGNDGGSYLVSSNPGGVNNQNYTLSTLDYSAGVIGTATTVVLPEPTAVALAAAGLAVLRRRRRPATNQPLVNGLESLESRRLLSSSIYAHLRHADVNEPSQHNAAATVAPVQTKASPTAAAGGLAQIHYHYDPLPVRHSTKLTNFTPLAGALNPTQLRNFYNVNALGTANRGQGMTIGIVDEFDDPNILADTNAFSAHYGLPTLSSGGPSLIVYKDTALGSVTSAAGTTVGYETSLDVEWAHAMAPLANILLVEVPATGSNYNAFQQLLHGVAYAAGQPKVGVVSLSYGLTESEIGGTSLVTSLDSTYLAPGTAAANVAVTVSTGDASLPLYPATSPNVIGVGGTSTYLASVRGNYSFETAWGGLTDAGAGGGGLSTAFGSPAFQSSHGVNFSNRSIPDVSLDADPVTGVSIYDSLDAGTGSPWSATGGTSLAAPLFAGIVTLAQQNRMAAGKALLSSTQIDNEIYTLYNSPAYGANFHDVTLGNNSNKNSKGTTTVTGYAAGTGYDQATGVGSPISNVLVSVLSAM